jgi:hypothetical protein
MVDAPVVPISPVIAVAVPWLVMPAPPPKTAKVDAAPRLGAEATEAFGIVLDKPTSGENGTAHAAKKAAKVRTPSPPRTFFVYVFIVLYLLVQIVYVIWPYVKYYLYIFYV